MTHTTAARNATAAACFTALILGIVALVTDVDLPIFTTVAALVTLWLTSYIVGRWVF